MNKAGLFSAAIIGMAPPVLMGGLPAVAQQRFDLQTVQIQAGTTIPVTSPTNQGTQYFYPDSTHAFSVTVPRDITNASGYLVIPAGSQVIGELRPVDGGLQFVGHSLDVNGQSRPVQATSQVLHDVKDPREVSAGSIAGDAAIGAAGGAVIGAVTGGISPLKVLGGAAAGVGVGNVTAPRVVALESGQTFELTFNSPVQW